MRNGLVVVVLAAMTVTGGASAYAQGEVSAVRPEDASIRALVATGLERSATFRDLKTRLDTSDVVVYIRVARCPAHLGACTAWASVSGGVRRLLVSLDRFGRSPDELTTLLAHELQHANEVASSPEITDPASFQKSFEARGWKHGSGLETGEAARITKTVRAELANDSGRIR